MIASVTTANGYQQTLLASRSMESFYDGDAVADLSVLCALSSGSDAVVKVSETLDADDPVTTWSQRFDAFVHILGRGGDAVAEDNRITRIVADVHKRIGVELAAQKATDGPYCGGLADAIDLLPWDIGVSQDLQCTLVNVPIRIQYRVLTRDPYTQP